MRIAARASWLSPVAHAVEDAGAVCGARPRGSWVLSERIPVNCPRCLLALTNTRYALCRTVEAVPRRTHVRVVGERGLKPREGIEVRSLCGQTPMIDLGLLNGSRPTDLCERCEKGLAGSRRPV